MEVPENVEEELKRRCNILFRMGAKKKIKSAFFEGKPLCSIMFRFDSIYLDIWTDIVKHELFKKIKADFEKNYKGYVYLGIYSERKEGAELTFLYVLEEDAKYWGKEREQLKNGNPLAYIYNFTEGYDDIVPITIMVRNGILVRIEE